ncbi:hypothetical protein PR048_026138 [Dryococelus australis]|uniref:LRAT domain-containing protein n=1 Tax=Dryococelus australis TaxID=614101 RepID=A0ABQ9GKK2_9NEOP|nr:hypothetical protein PR048_026138 [Dryococelus australis]
MGCRERGNGVTCSGRNRNEDGFLHAYYKEYRPNGTEKLRKLGKVFISPAKLRAIARDNERNGRCYDVVDNNCQDWAFRAAMDISKDVGMEASRIPAVTPILSVARHLLGWDVIRMFLLGFKPAERIMPGRC